MKINNENGDSNSYKKFYGMLANEVKIINW